MTLKDYKDIIQEFGEQDPILAHSEENESVFYKSPEEAQNFLSNLEREKIVLLIVPYDKDVKASRADNGTWIKQGMVLALGGVLPDDEEDQLRVQDVCEQVNDRLYAYLYHKRGQDQRVFGISIENWSCEGIGPVGENHYGYCAVFNLKDPVKL